MSNNYQLVFLISQPRAGSTLLQRMIAAHPAVHTQSEPWIMLHPMHAFKPENILAPYKSEIYADATKDFIESLPGGIDTYKKKLGRHIRGIL